MRRQHALRTLRGIDQKRYVVGVQPVGGMGYQRAQRVGLDEAVQRFGARLGKVGRDVHGGRGWVDVTGACGAALVRTVHLHWHIENIQFSTI